MHREFKEDGGEKFRKLHRFSDHKQLALAEHELKDCLMKQNLRFIPLCFGMACMVLMLAALSCEVLDDDIEEHASPQDSTVTDVIGLDEVAELFSTLPITHSHLNEVHDAVTSSSGNGYDEEYTMKNLFEAPGAGVGERETKAEAAYDNPLRELLEAGVRAQMAADTGAVTKAMGRREMTADEYLAALMSSGIQVYWPFSEEWDGTSMPVITYDPEDGSEVNIGYEMIIGDDGSRRVQEVIVDEATAMERPVWVVNRNSDAEYTTLELLRREDPDWGEGGGCIIVSKSGSTDGQTVRTLVLKDFTMKRNFDSWFAGASEFFVKTGSVEDFTASTEAELRLYNPLVTDFMIVVKRSQVGEPVPFNAILVSDWIDGLDDCAFMITEDDGGTKEKWDLEAIVKYNSKSYGVDISIPFNSRDDVVWRGMLSKKWFRKNIDVPAQFGDVELTFGLQEY